MTVKDALDGAIDAWLETRKPGEYIPGFVLNRWIAENQQATIVGYKGSGKLYAYRRGDQKQIALLSIRRGLWPARKRSVQ